MAFEIVSSSPQAIEAAKSTEADNRYPFDKLEVGKSFTCQLSEVKWKSLRTCVYQRNSREAANGTGVQFKFIKHDDLGVAEVARIS